MFTPKFILPCFNLDKIKKKEVFSVIFYLRVFLKIETKADNLLDINDKGFI